MAINNKPINYLIIYYRNEHNTRKYTIILNTVGNTIYWYGNTVLLFDLM